MNLRTKVTILLAVLMLTFLSVVVFHANNTIRNIFEKQALNNFRIIAEQSENSYLSFLGSMRTRTLDWTSDNTIRELARSIIAAPDGSPERQRYAKEFSNYVSRKKMPFDQTVIITDLLDKNGIVIASTRPERIGKNEKGERSGTHLVHDFSDTINSKFGEVFFGRITLDEEESPEPTMNASARLFEIEQVREFKPMDAVLLIYFENASHIAEALGSGSSIYTSTPEQQRRLSKKAFLETYHTADIYLVNDDHTVITHSRGIAGESMNRKLDTLPVRECFDKNKEVSGEYENARNMRVLGSSMCFKDAGVVILVEVDKDEVFTPINALVRSTLITGIMLVILGFLIAMFLADRMLGPLGSATPKNS